MTGDQCDRICANIYGVAEQFSRESYDNRVVLTDLSEKFDKVIELLQQLVSAQGPQLSTPQGAALQGLLSTPVALGPSPRGNGNAPADHESEGSQ